LSNETAGIGTVIRTMVQQHVAELAVINGRPRHGTSNPEWEEAMMRGDAPFHLRVG